MKQSFPDVFEVGFTAQMETELDKVEEGDLRWQRVLEDFWGPFSKALAAVDVERLIHAVHDLSTLPQERCPNCGGPLIVKSGRFGPFIACAKYPECKFSKPIRRDKVPDRPTDEVCRECGAPMVIKTGRYGEFLACTRYPKCKHTRPVPLGVKCPKCGEGDLAERRTRKGRNFFGCLRYPACDYSVWNRPVAIACPSCGFVGMEEKQSKATGVAGVTGVTGATAQVPGGAALAVDRVAFADHVQQRVSAHPKITVAREEATALPSPGVVATGPLTSEALAGAIARRLDATALAFFDAIAPIVSDESLDHDRLFRASRYGKGGGDDYWNAPLTASEYDAFVTALCGAEQHRPHHEFDRAPYFEGCLPIEELAERGRDTLRFGPMKPVGLRDPRARARGAAHRRGGLPRARGDGDPRGGDPGAAARRGGAARAAAHDDARRAVSLRAPRGSGALPADERQLRAARAAGAARARQATKEGTARRAGAGRDRSLRGAHRRLKECGMRSAECAVAPRSPSSWSSWPRSGTTPRTR